VVNSRGEIVGSGGGVVDSHGVVIGSRPGGAGGGWVLRKSSDKS
jgi:hypothetical protein